MAKAGLAAWLILRLFPAQVAGTPDHAEAAAGTPRKASLATTQPGVPAVMTPLAQDLATATGFSTDAVIMTRVVGFSAVIFPYPAAPLIVAMGLAKEPVRALLRTTLALAGLTVVVLLPLDLLWWKLLGWI